MPNETLDPKQQDGRPDRAADDELEALHKLPSAKRKEPVGADQLQQHYDMPSAGGGYDDSGASPSSPGGKKDTGKPAAGKAPDGSKSLYNPRHDDNLGGLANMRPSFKGAFRFARNNRGKTMLAATAAAIVTAVIIGFLFLLPLKILSLISNIQRTFAATSTSAVSNESEHLLDKYMIKKVLPSLGGACHSTLSAECSISKSTGTSPVSTLFNAWREDRLENKLATDHGIILGKKGNTYFISTNGKAFGLGGKPTSIFNIQGVNTTSSRAEIRAAINKALEDKTLWQRVLFRFRFGRFLEKKYGVVRCIITCKLGDQFADTVADKKLAAKGYIIRRVIAPVNESYALIMQCILSGGCSLNLDKAEPGETTKQSEFQKKLQAQLDKFAAQYGSDALKDLIKQADDIGKDGLKKYIARELAKKAGSAIGKDVTGDTAAKAVPVVGWAIMLARLAATAKDIGPMIQYMSYAANGAAAVQLYESYATVASEMQSGHVDSAELGSFSEALSSNLDGAADNQSDLTQTPLYQSLYSNSANSASMFGNLFSAKAYAASSTGQASTDKKYLCDDGKPVPSGQLLCYEEKLNRGNKDASAISSSVSSVINSVPYLGKLISAVNRIGNAVNGAIGTVFSYACNYVFSIHTVFFGVYGCKTAMDFIGKQAANLMDFLSKKLIISPFSTHQSGGRTGDMVIAGGDVLFNSACQEQLGCAQQSSQAIADIRSSQIAEAQAEFNSRPVFSRIFSTDTPYSLVSRIAISMPGNTQSALTRVADFFANPFGGLGATLGGIFGGRQVLAAAGPQADPFGVVQYGYTDSQIPQDPETYWDKNCVNGPMAKYDSNTQQLDISDWLNNDPSTEQNGQPNTAQDPNTGEEVNLKPNPCMLIKASTEALGGLMDPGMLPAGSMNSDTTTGSTGGTASPPGGTTSAPSGSAQSLAQQLLDLANSGKIVFDHEWDKFGDASDGSSPEQNIKEMASGQPAKTTSDCSGRGAQAPNSQVALNTDLLKFLVELGQAQKYQINALAGECHSSSASNHYKGVAVDFGCPFDPSQANSIGQKYNISDGTGETCSSGAGHYHYSIGGH